jgi:hypothetical protein
MRLAASSCIGLFWILSPAQADTSLFAKQVDEILLGVEQAAYAENLLPFLIEYEDPRVSEAIASEFGVQVETFHGRVISGYLQSTERTDLMGIEIFRDDITFGQSQGQDWAVVSYSVEILLLPAEILPATCNRLVFHNVDGVVHVSMISTPMNEMLLKRAIPELAAAVDETTAFCPDRLS